jgi:hypothetical protein
MTMLNRRYALLGWVVWKGGKIVAKRRAKAMLPAERRSLGAVVIVPAIAVAGAAAWLLFFRRRGAEHETADVG